MAGYVFVDGEGLSAQKINDYLNHSGRVKSGMVPTSGTSIAAGTGAGPFAVVFSDPFDEVPHVVCSAGSAAGGTQYLVPRVTGVTENGFNVYVYNVGSSPATFALLAVNWIASLFGNPS